MVWLGLLSWAAGSSQALAQDAEAFRKTWQTRLIMAEAGDTLRFPTGTFACAGSLSLDGKQDIVLIGAGMDQTVISFADQQEGAEGLRISDCQNITLQNMTLQDAKGDLVKVMDTDGITFRNLKVEWTGRPKKTNGAYGLYPVSCQRVLIEGCEAIGASDAGIYVGQSHHVVVRSSRAYHNVAGIEIENTTQAEVYDCEATENTGGILVFDLPDLPKAKGGHVRVYNNRVYANNYRNFAPKGNIVATVPPGTGVMVLATNQVEIFDNEIRDNRTAGLALISYYMTETPIQDSTYYPYPTAIFVHDNQFIKTKRRRPTLKNRLGILFNLKFGKNVPDILYDGIVDRATLDESGQVKPAARICIRNNGGATFANLDAENDFQNISRDLAPHDCSREALEGITFSAKE